MLAVIKTGVAPISNSRSGASSAELFEIEVIGVSTAASARISGRETGADGVEKFFTAKELGHGNIPISIEKITTKIVFFTLTPNTPLL